MKAIKIIFPALALLTLASCTVKQVQTDRRVVSVLGRGEVFVENDQAVITLSVNTRNWDVAKAVQENADKMTSVQNAILNLGISNDMISTSSYNVYQEQSYQNGRNVPGQYAVSNQISVQVKDVKLTGKVIDTAVKAGANSLQSVTYSASNTENAIKQARILAVKNAESKANTLATSSGCSLGPVIRITEANNYSTTRSANKLMYAMAEDAVEAETPLASGKSVVTVSIEADFELK